MLDTVNLANIIEEHDANRVALVDGEDRITYGQLQSWAAAFREVLLQHQVGSDDRVAIAAGNEPMFIAAALATLGMGARVIPMKPSNPLPELDRKLESIRPTLVITCEESLWMLEHTERIGSPVLDGRTVPRASETAPSIVDRHDDDIAFMMLTSGVSGNAKVAMLSHHNLLWAQQAVTENTPDGLNAEDVALGVLPFSHIFGLNGILLATLRVGGTVVLERRFNVDESLRLVQEHGITILAGAPPMWRRWSMIDAPDDVFSGVRIAASGASALSAQVFNDVKARYNIEIEEAYGLTETSPVLTSSRHLIKPGSVGQAVEDVELMLVEEDGTAVDVGDAGEIVVRGPGIFQGYFENEEATEQVLTEDGWFWTGDLGVLDATGHLYIVDRIKDIVIVSGFNVYPAEVENVLMEHPAVRGAVVVGGMHLDTGETVIAHVSGDVDLAELDAFARERLSRYKCPTEYHSVDELPVAPTGKLIRRELR